MGTNRTDLELSFMINVSSLPYPILDFGPFLFKVGLGDPGQGLDVSPQCEGILLLELGHPAGSRMFGPAGRRK